MKTSEYSLMFTMAGQHCVKRRNIVESIPESKFCFYISPASFVELEELMKNLEI